MEWVETTGKSMEEAKELALDRLGVAADEAEFEVLEEPRSGLFGRVRGEARVRARVMPASVRPKQERRSRGSSKGRDGEARPAALPGCQTDAFFGDPALRSVCRILLRLRSVRHARPRRDRSVDHRKPFGAGGLGDLACGLWRDR